MESNFHSARFIQTDRHWDDLVLTEEAAGQLAAVRQWLQQRKSGTGIGKTASGKPAGKSILFRGVAGTGKSLTASLLGKYSGQQVLRVDLSQVLSRYAGETEKNLDALFQKAEDENLILFFDEADALFGKRTEVKDAHDKYANQELAYLLQRVETFSGLSIISSTAKGNIDSSFMRRINLVVSFPPR